MNLLIYLISHPFLTVFSALSANILRYYTFEVYIITFYNNIHILSPRLTALLNIIGVSLPDGAIDSTFLFHC